MGGAVACKSLLKRGIRNFGESWIRGAPTLAFGRTGAETQDTVALRYGRPEDGVRGIEKMIKA